MTNQKNKKIINQEIQKIENEMNSPNFWNDKNLAQVKIKELEKLKLQLEGGNKYDKGDAVMTIFSGAGGDDSEDFSRMLFVMYTKFINDKGWMYKIINENKNNNSGYRNITFEIQGKGVYKTLKNESGVHRLVRISPFNSNKKRHTSFSMVEVIPKIKELKEININEDDLEIIFSKSGGPGGQNVNKRETAVRIIHKPTKISARIGSERTQEQNKQKALEILSGKLYNFYQEQKTKEKEGLSVSKTTDNEWGSQIRSYVLHPYKMVKDHRTGVEVRDVDKVLNGEIEKFLFTNGIKE